ncbi:cerevisin [Nematocida sp. LUAm3]|nr:cerevisin [Nematocida sp. LUAm3]KAI5173772.1 cerevisin [Nematocida sp. LUAm2]KAI5176995.1 cerevisin [Nematocida sp. LUAm1]
MALKIECAMAMVYLVLLSFVHSKRYVVLLQENLPQMKIEEHKDWIYSNGLHLKGIKGFSAPGIYGYSADLSDYDVASLKKRKEVIMVEENQEYKIQTEMEDKSAVSRNERALVRGYNLLDTPYGDFETFKSHKTNQKVGQNRKKNWVEEIGEAENNFDDVTFFEVNVLHNVLKGRRHYRKSPIKRMFRNRRKRISFFEIDNKKDKGSFTSAFIRLHYPENSSNLIASSAESWGISRISQRGQIYSLDTYIYPKSAGEGVYVYVLDTGVEHNHPELKGKVELGIDIVNGKLDGEDDNGHGTHCAGIISGVSSGVAKNSKIVPVKILNADGVGTTEHTILGLVYVMKEHHRRLREQKSPKSIINMSLGGVKSPALKEIIQRIIRMRVHVVAAGGNDSSDACNYSPASIKQAITVGAIDMHDEIAIFSNTGKCVDIYAPGVEILSSHLHKSMRVLSGTSMAAPHVAGLAALYLSENNYSPEELKVIISADSIKSGIIKIASSKMLNLRMD